MKSRQYYTMFMNRVAFAVILLFVPFWVSAQDYFYYSNQQKILFDKAEHWVSVMVPDDQRSLFLSRISEEAQIRIRQNLNEKSGIFWLETTTGLDIRSMLAQTSLNAVNLRSFPVYYYVSTNLDTTWFAATDEFNVRFEDHTTKEEIERLNDNYQVEVAATSDFGRYTLRITEESPYNTLEIANRYYEDPATKWSLPNFYMNIQVESNQDTYFGYKWHLQNTGQSGAVSGIDISAVPAWEISTGINDITIAIIDSDVEDHEDFSSGQVLSGHTAGPTSGFGEPIGNGAGHGQAVAGIAVANHNSIGIRGVTSNVRILPINIFAPNTNNGHIADAIDWAWQNDAWCRWSGGFAGW